MKTNAAKNTGRYALSPFTFARYSVPHEKHPERNEDALLSDPEHGFAAIFDGVGGGPGHIASRMAARYMRKGWRNILAQAQPHATLAEESDEFDIPEMLRQLILATNEQICTKGMRQAEVEAKKAAVNEKEHPKRPSTTMALAVFCLRRDGISYNMIYAHVGDSRIYLLRANEGLQRLTSDDGYFSILLENGVLNESDILRIDQALYPDELDQTERSYFDKRNGITQALGLPTLNIHLAQTVIGPGDRILLCTDGLHDNLRDVEIADMLKYGTRTTVAKLLVGSAIKRSHEDSTTTIRAKADDISALVVTCNY